MGDRTCRHLCISNIFYLLRFDSFRLLLLLALCCISNPKTHPTASRVLCCLSSGSPIKNYKIIFSLSLSLSDIYLLTLQSLCTIMSHAVSSSAGWTVGYAMRKSLSPEMCCERRQASSTEKHIRPRQIPLPSFKMWSYELFQNLM